MPLVLRTDELQEGMRLGDALIFNGMVMLPAGKILTPADIQAVRRRFPNVGMTVGDPVLDEVVDFEDDKHERTVAKEAQKKIVKSMEHVQGRFNKRTDASKINFKAMAESVNDVMEYIRDNPVSSALSVAASIQTAIFRNTPAMCFIFVWCWAMQFVITSSRNECARPLPRHFHLTRRWISNHWDSVPCSWIWACIPSAASSRRKVN